MTSGTAGSPAATRRGEAARGALVAAAALAAFTALAVGLFWSAWSHPGKLWIGIGGDPNLVTWFLAWVPLALGHGHNPLLTDWLNYPSGVNLMWNTSMSLLALPVWPVMALWGPAAAYNALLTASVALSAWTAFLALRWITGSTAGAFAGGLLYGFSPYMLTESMAHVHVVAAFMPPVILVLLYDLLVSRRRPPLRTGAWLGVACAAQMLIGEEVLVGTALAAAVGVVVIALLHRAESAARFRAAWHGVAEPRAHGGDRTLAALLLGLVVMLALLAYPLAVQFLGPHRLHGVIQPRGLYESDLLGFVLPTPVQAIAPQSALDVVGKFSGNGTEWNAYLGVPLIALLVAGTWALRRRPLALWAGWSTLVMAILSLGPHLRVSGADTHLHLPEVLLDRMPVLGNLQANRLALFTDCFAAVLVAVIVAELPRMPRWRRPGLAALALAAVPLLPSLPFPTVPAEFPPYFQDRIRADVPAGSVVLVLPFADPKDSDAMAWQTASGMYFKMPEGYMVSDNPDGTPRFSVRPTTLSRVTMGIRVGQLFNPEDDRAPIDNELLALHVREVVVGPMLHRDVMLAYWRDHFGRPPDEDVEGVQVWRLG